MIIKFINIFTALPKNVCMTYFQHFIFSMKLSFHYCLYSYKAFVHAIIPSLYITSSSDSVKEIEDVLKEAGCK